MRTDRIELIHLVVGPRLGIGGAPTASVQVAGFWASIGCYARLVPEKQGCLTLPVVASPCL